MATKIKLGKEFNLKVYFSSMDPLTQHSRSVYNSVALALAFAMILLAFVPVSLLAPVPLLLKS